MDAVLYQPKQSDAVIGVAIYNGLGRLLQFATETITQSGKVIVPITIPSTEYIIKAMLWNDTSTVQPLCEGKQLCRGDPCGRLCRMFEIAGQARNDGTHPAKFKGVTVRPLLSHYIKKQA